MTTPLAKLLAAQSRDSAEAARVTSAVAAAGPGADAATLDTAISDTYADLAEEQRPRRSPAPPAHQAEFVDAPDTAPELGFSDAEPSVSNHRTDARFLLSDDDPEPEPDDEPEPTPAPRPAAWERHAAQPAPEPEYLPTPPPVPAAEPDPAPSTLQDRLRGIDARQARKAAVYGIGSTLLVAAIVASFTISGRGRPPEPAVQVAPPPAANDTAPPTPARTEGVLVPATVSASCGNDSDAVAPFSGDPTRAWVCRRHWGLEGSVLNISFSCPVIVTAITVVPGFAYVHPDGRDEWVRHRLVTSISWRMGGAIYPQAIVPTRTGVTMRLPGTGVITQVLSATITSSMRPPMGESSTDDFGSKADDAAKVDEHTAIGRIVINGYPVDPGSGMCGSQTSTTPPTGGTS